MGGTSSKYLPVPPEDMAEIQSSTKFTQGEIDYLYVRFRELGAPSSRVRFLIKKDFSFVSSVLRSIIMGAMFGEKNRLSFPEFVKFLYHFRPRDRKNTPAENAAMTTKKLKLLFSMYDQNNDGNIDHNDLLEIVHRLLSLYASIQTMLDVVGIIMSEMDLSNAGTILYEDFCKAFEPIDMEQLVVKFPVIK